MTELVRGQGGGSKKGGGARNIDDTIESQAYVTIVDALSEGEIGGLVAGKNSIYINRTRLPNIKNATWQSRNGRPDDAPLEGIGQVETLTSVGAEIDGNIGPIVRTITDTSIDVIKIHITLNMLYKETKNGLGLGNYGWAIDMRSPGSSTWENVYSHTVRSQKTMVPVQYIHSIRVSNRPGPWDIRVREAFARERKTTANGIWTGYSLATDAKLTYPNTAVVGLNLSAEHVGSGQVTRHYHIRGRKILVPGNYDPIKRTYTGVWVGNFKRVYSNNPAWVLYDLIENDIFGLGSHVDLSVVNKWQLYAIAQACDAPVPTGYGNETEPRYTFNGVITNKQEALDALRSITTTWRGMGFYALSQFHTTIDAPSDLAFVYGPANVIDGRFEYSTTSLKARHSVVMVRYNDPNNMFDSAVEPYIDDEMLKMVGWREKSVELAGCSSRSLARRYAKWIVETEKSETETVTFTVGLDSVAALPGEIIGINDPRRARIRASGRLVSASASTIAFDLQLPAELGDRITVRVQGKDGTLLALSGTPGPARMAMNVDVADRAKLAKIESGAFLLISTANLAPEQFRILSIDENTDNTYKITAVSYDPGKYARIENGIVFDEVPTKAEPDILEAPTDVEANLITYSDGGAVRTDVEMKWTRSKSPLVTGYLVYATTAGQANALVYSGADPGCTFSTTATGTVVFRVQAVAMGGLTSALTRHEVEIEGGNALPLGRIDGLMNAENMQTGAANFSGTSFRLSWRNMLPRTTTGEIEEAENDNALYKHTVVEFFINDTKVRTARLKGTAFTYTAEMNLADSKLVGLTGRSRTVRAEVYLVDTADRSSARSTIAMHNPAPAAITPSVDFQYNEMTVTLPFVDDPDHAGYMVWIGATPDFKVNDASRIYKGKNTRFAYRGVAGATRYIRVAAFDAFSEADMEISEPVMVVFGQNISQVADKAIAAANTASDAAAAAAMASEEATRAAAESGAAAVAANGAAASADESRAEALTFSQNAARLMSGGVSRNPTFNLWDNESRPTNLGVFLGEGNVVARHTAAQAGNMIRYESAAYIKGLGGNNGPCLRLEKNAGKLDCSVSPLAVLATVEIEYISGDLAASGSFVRGVWADGVGNKFTYHMFNGTLTPTPGIIQKVECYLKRPDAANPETGWNFWVEIYGSTNVGGTRAPTEFRVHRFDFQEVLANSQTALTQQAIADVNGIKSSVIGLRAVAGSADASLELVALDSPNGSASAARISADNILLDGTVQAKHLQVDFLSAGRIQASSIDLNAMLSIATSGGFRIGKRSFYDDATDGIYMGNMQNDFGLSVSRTVDKKLQALKLSKNGGLKIINATHYVVGEAAPVTVPVNANITKTKLPAGIKRISLEMIGGGSGGVGYLRGTTTYSSNKGGTTVVRLYDGDTLKATYTAPGGDAPDVNVVTTAVAGSPGEGTVYGPGGVARTPAPITSYGAGGGGIHHRLGGNASKQVQVPDVDLSTWTDPQIEVVLGLAGASLDHGGSGTRGYVAYSYSLVSYNAADVIPLAPTSYGIINKQGSGFTPIPALGAGLWVISTLDGSDLDIGRIVISGNNIEEKYIYAKGGGSITFVSIRSPATNANYGFFNHKQFAYAHYAMGSWG